MKNSILMMSGKARHPLKGFEKYSYPTDASPLLDQWYRAQLFYRSRGLPLSGTRFEIF